jgi:hypothetical protein
MPTATVPTLSLTPADVNNLADALRPLPRHLRLVLQPFRVVYMGRTLSARAAQPTPAQIGEPIVIAQLGASDKAIRGMQQFLTDSTWDDAAILRRHWQEVAVDLDDAAGMRIVDGSDFPKKGRNSVGVKRQSCGELGKIANCQAGVFLAYASTHGVRCLISSCCIACCLIYGPTPARTGYAA